MGARLRLRVLDDAVADIAEISGYIAYKSGLDAAIRFEARVGDTLSFLQAMPHAGRRVRERQAYFAELRTCAVKTHRNFIVYYSVEANQLVVVRVVHGATRRSLRSAPPPR